jgi:hypothetical protein
MRNSVVAFGILLAVACGFETFVPGSVGICGSSVHTLRDGKSLLYTIYGWERISSRELRAVSVLHALVLVPPGTPPVTWQGSYGDGRDEAETTFEWMLGEPSPTTRKLTLRYDDQRNELSVAGRVLPAKAGNLFVITLDEHWRPVVRQLPARVTECKDAPSMLALFKAHDASPRVQSAESHLR